MEITAIDEFLPYFEKIRSRTLNVIQSIPSEHLEWTYKQGKFTFGDIIRHIAATERYMYAENAQFKKSSYPGCGEELAAGYDQVLAFLNELHLESVDIFSKLTPEDLQKKCTTPGGIPITLWKWLRAMIEHEVHHRGQLFIYLGMIGVQSQPIFGLTSEEVKARSLS